MRLPLLIILGTALAVGALLLSHEGKDFVRDGRIDYTRAVAHWRKVIRSDPERAYPALQRMAEPLGQYDAHLLAHSFGEALYQESGALGLSTCGDDFGWGCAHQFVATALRNSNGAAANKLSASCEGVSGLRKFACYHGMGHGVLGYLGYEQSRLTEALAACREITPNTTFNACADGVFMEYNLRFLLSLESNGTFVGRAYDPAAPYAPCRNIPEAFIDECAYELPKWWFSVLEAASVESRIRAVGALCEYTPLGSFFSRMCFEGVGTAAAMGSSLDTSNASRICALATADTRSRLHCFSGAAQRFMHFGIRDACVSFGLEGDALAYCGAYAEDDQLEKGMRELPGTM